MGKELQVSTILPGAFQQNQGAASANQAFSSRAKSVQDLRSIRIQLPRSASLPSLHMPETAPEAAHSSRSTNLLMTSQSNVSASRLSRVSTMTARAEDRAENSGCTDSKCVGDMAACMMGTAAAILLYGTVGATIGAIVDSVSGEPTSITGTMIGALAGTTVSFVPGAIAGCIAPTCEAGDSGIGDRHSCEEGVRCAAMLGVASVPIAAVGLGVGIYRTVQHVGKRLHSVYHTCVNWLRGRSENEPVEV